MSKFYHLSIITTVGVSSFIAGHFYKGLDSVNPSNNAFFDTVFAKSLAVSNKEESEIDLNKLSPPSNVPVTKSTRISQIMKYGFPSLDNVKSFDDYVLSYDKRNRVPNWVLEHLTAENTKFNPTVDRATCIFTEDVSIHPFFRSYNSDYKGSGFDRGHLAAAGNHKSRQELCEQTFLLSNMAPQVGPGFNRHSWNRLEKYTRKLTRKFSNVYVCTGPLYLPKIEDDGLMYVKYRVIGNSHVAVPTHFFKVLLLENADQSFEVEAYVLPNQAISDDIPLTNFRVPPETIERAAGLLFYDKISNSTIRSINGKKGTWTK